MLVLIYRASLIKSFNTTHHLRCIERLKARNERLTAALERRKADSKLISMKLCRLESDCSALQMALRYWYLITTPDTLTCKLVCTNILSQTKLSSCLILLSRSV